MEHAGAPIRYPGSGSWALTARHNPHMARMLRRLTVGSAFVVGGVVGVLLLTGGAGAQSDPSSPQPASELDKICEGRDPCVIINNVARPEAPGGEFQAPMQAFENQGRAAADCPAATSAYARAGVPVDAYFGGCPSEAEARDEAAGMRPLNPEALGALEEP